MGGPDLCIEEPFVSVSPGTFQLRAPLRFASVARLRAAGLALIESGPETLTLDLSSVPSADSAGLALLIDWLARARAAHKALRYSQAPPALLALARLSEVEPLLSSSAELADRPAGSGLTRGAQNG